MHKTSSSTRNQFTRKEYDIKVFDLELFDTYYYIKRSTIVEKIVFNNRTFYAKFERKNEPLTPLILQQHFQRDYTIAIPLLKEQHTNYLVIEYKGEEHVQFQALIQHLFKKLNICNYHIYQGRSKEKLQVFIFVSDISLEDAHHRLAHISSLLEEKMSKKWKTLPSLLLPESYNIITLPYDYI